MRRICASCQRIYQTEDAHSANLCDSCQTEYEKGRSLCREYVIANPGATVAEVSRAVGLPSRTIRKLIEDGSIAYVANQKAR